MVDGWRPGRNTGAGKNDPKSGVALIPEFFPII